MSVKKSGNVLISTILILSLIIIIGNCSFKIMKNNKEIQNLYCNDGGIYDFRSKEKKLLINFMKNFNKRDIDELLSDDFKENYKEDSLVYNKEKDIFYLSTYINKHLKIEREVNYMVKNNKILFIPTYKTKIII
ncbi:hypothetical protein [Clostridium weizhouense]|uniref:Lipoprotein n=1 Tax=Clostridium weizhouense TaxID=2859781 RepID=A0ABS7AQJ0_9CLOT|nr:hypothetical protein [Clostridium weizhouense]MBW6410931.1 hypothetical protein [Clostridium weizhouense]